MKEPLKKDLKRILDAYQNAINLNMVCSMTDLEGNITYVNQKFCDKSQFTKEELIGQNHRIINSGFHPATLFENMWLTIKSGEIWQGEVKSKAKDGTFFWLHSVIIPIFDDHKKITQFFSLRFPIDEKKKREKEIDEQAKQAEEILFMISHKVRQPIANILGIASLIENHHHPQIDIDKMIGYIHESAKSLDLFAKELSSFIEDSKNQRIKDLP